MLSWFELIRLLAAFGLVFLALPYAAQFARRRRGAGHLELAVTGFVQATFFVQTSGMILGDWRLYLPGAAVVSFSLFLGGVALFAARRRGPLTGAVPSRRILYGKLLAWLDRRGESKAAAGWLKAGRRQLGVPLVAALLMVTAAVSLRSVEFALHHVRMERIESYARAISMQALMRGEAWDHDASIVLAAPLSMISGLPADAVIRLSGALVTSLLVLATAWSALNLLGRGGAALAAATILAGTMIATHLTPAEPGAAEWAAIFLVLAIGLLRNHGGAAVLSLLTGLLIHQGIGVQAWLAVMSITAASLAAPAAHRVPALRPLLPALSALLVVAAALGISPKPAAAPLQYDAAARTAHRIAAEFRTNDWLVISPGFEVAQTYGRGWHAELADFVNAQTEEQLRNPAYRLPYATGSIFVFVEKRVLDQPMFSFSQNGDRASYYYGTRLGRASLEFRAARLMAAYRASHRDTSIYYEDDDIVVYRIAQPAEPAKLASRAGAQLQ